MISNVLNTTGFYDKKDISLFEREINFRNLQKDEILLHKGQVAKSIFFNLKGAIYQYNFKTETDHNVIDLHIENEWFLNHKSFVLQVPSENYIAAFTQANVLEISIESIHYLIGQSPAFLQLNKILGYANSRVHFFDNVLTPLQKYQFIMENKPQLIQKFPLKIIASYLKVSPETLSRSREKFAKNKFTS
nr:Crp/Fnr family transcriptional regulator [Pedobacter panaciterrae]